MRIKAKGAHITLDEEVDFGRKNYIL